MGLRGRLTTYNISGGTRAIRIWKGVELSKTPTAAASRLILIDPRGKIPPNVLNKLLDATEKLRKDWEVENEK